SGQQPEGIDDRTKRPSSKTRCRGNNKPDADQGEGPRRPPGVRRAAKHAGDRQSLDHDQPEHSDDAPESDEQSPRWTTHGMRGKTDGDSQDQGRPDEKTPVT